jgi:hypothetical protein
MQEEKPKRCTSAAYALSYACALPALVEVARQHGYALSVHGSMHTDLDLIAVPWIEEASEAEELVEAIRACIGGMFSGGAETAKQALVDKPHGRRSCSILPSEQFLGVPPLPFKPWIDLSIMPKVKTDDQSSE